LKISIVIATIGNRNLLPTINSLNNNTIKPDEIIISITSKYLNEFEELKTFNNVKIVLSRFKGQVKQRIEGFKNVKNNIVVQLDDDIILKEDCLEKLKNSLKENGNCAVSPNLFDINLNKSIYNKKIGFKRKIFNFISHGKFNINKGKITDSGFEVNPILIENNQEIVSTEWLVGGCVMHLKKNLILNDYFKFEGKAYCEDLYHSLLLKKNGVKLFVDSSAIAYLKIEEENFRSYFLNLKNDVRVRKKLVLKENLNIYRMYFVYIILIFKRVLSGK
tara:strand:+ start:7626 stop:8453 length:828 start_codon:yes stop_codon:yes gene_type:complete